MDTSDAVYRDLVEQQQDLIVKISLEGRLLFFNTAYSEFLGKPKEELAGSVFMPVSCWLDVKAFQASVFSAAFI